MAIRMRWIKEKENRGYVALCAAESLPEEGDVYLDDGMHGSLTEKFTKDFIKMGFMRKDYVI